MYQNVLHKIVRVAVFSGTIDTRILKRGMYMDNKLFYCAIADWTYCSYSSLCLSIFWLNLWHSCLTNSDN